MLANKGEQKIPDRYFLFCWGTLLSGWFWIQSSETVG